MPLYRPYRMCDVTPLAVQFSGKQARVASTFAVYLALQCEEKLTSCIVSAAPIGTVLSADRPTNERRSNVEPIRNKLLLSRLSRATATSNRKSPDTLAL